VNAGKAAFIQPYFEVGIIKADEICIEKYLKERLIFYFR
jgi:hypothetical protein